MLNRFCGHAKAVRGGKNSRPLRERSSERGCKSCMTMPTATSHKDKEVMGNQSLRLCDAPADPKGFPNPEAG